MSKKWALGVCNETSGLLFSHECPRPSTHVCGYCSKPVCQEHMDRTFGRVLCLSCAKKQIAQGKKPTLPKDSRRNRSSSTAADREKPMPYSSGFNHGHIAEIAGGFWAAATLFHLMQEDNDNFNEGDAESLIDEGSEPVEGDEGNGESETTDGFESDMNES